MSDATLNDVVDRLERLETALLKIVTLMEDRRDGASAADQSAKDLLASALAVAAATAPAPLPAGPPVVPVTPAAPPPLRNPGGRPPTDMVAPRVNASGRSARSDEADGEYDPYAHRHDLPVPGVDATVRDILTRVFEAALMPDPEDTWALLTKMTHSNQLVGPRSMDHFKAFAWHKARRTALSYLEGGDPKSFVMSYTEPAEINENDQQVKIFVRKTDGRMPAPIALAKDPKKGGGWRITMISL